MGRKNHSNSHKDLAEKEDKHKPKSKTEKKLEQQLHKAKKHAKAEEAKKAII
jgi:hypothetical protein